MGHGNNRANALDLLFDTKLSRFHRSAGLTIVAAAAPCLVGPRIASGATVHYETPWSFDGTEYHWIEPVMMADTGGSGTTKVPQFNETLGTLTSATVSFSASATLEWGANYDGYTEFQMYAYLNIEGSGPVPAYYISDYLDIWSNNEPNPSSSGTDYFPYAYSGTLTGTDLNQFKGTGVWGPEIQTGIGVITAEMVLLGGVEGHAEGLLSVDYTYTPFPSLMAQVPEPAVIAWFSMGSILTGNRRRRRLAANDHVRC